jgi:hypothetical protein
MCGVWRGYVVAGVEGGEFTLRLILRQKVAPLYWRSDTHTHTYGCKNGCVGGSDVCNEVPERNSIESFFGVIKSGKVYILDGRRE